MSTTALYRLWGRSGELLYVGISLSVARRLGEHSADKAWWPEVATVTIQNHPTRKAALAAESFAIRTEGPRYNLKRSTDRVEPPSPLPSGRLAFSLAETATILGVGLWQVNEYRYQGRLAARRLGKRAIIARDDLERLMIELERERSVMA